MNSSLVESRQTEMHKHLHEIVVKHTTHVYQKPFAKHTLDVYQSVYPLLQTARENGVPILLDSGCGTGESTIALAEEHSSCFVLGADRSIHRIKKSPPTPHNALILHADCVDLWRLLRRTSIPIEKHYLLFPNPSPKSEHLMRRWHAHPVFGDMCTISTHCELRTNWDVYATEFAYAATLFFTNRRDIRCEAKEYTVSTPLTNFERKYAASNHTLWKVEW